MLFEPGDRFSHYNNICFNLQNCPEEASAVECMVDKEMKKRRRN
jgi:hypothetical protein